MSSSIMPTPDICAAQPVDSEVLQRLLQAARRGNVAGVRDAFSGGVPPDSLLTQGGRTALHVSAHHGFVQVALTIIGFGASVNAASKSGHTPLHEASTQGHTKMCHLLLSLDADTQARSKDGSTSLMLACHGGHLNTCRILLSAKADINAINLQHWTALHYAAFNGDMEVVRLMLHLGANADAINSHGKTPDMLALEEGHTTCYRELLNARGLENATSDMRITALEGQLLLLREQEQKLKRDHELLLSAEQTSLYDELESVVLGLQEQLREKDLELQEMRNELRRREAKMSVLPKVETVYSNSAPSSPRPPRKLYNKAKLVKDGTDTDETVFSLTSFTDSLPDELGGKSLTDLIEYSIRNPNSMASIRKEIKSEGLTPRINKRFGRKLQQKSLSPLATTNDETSIPSKSPPVNMSTPLKGRRGNSEHLSKED